MIDRETFLALEIPLAILICIIYIFSALAIHVIQDRYGFTLWFHESSLSCIVGFIVGGILKAATGTSVSFNGDLFFFMILPPIIFSAGYSLRRKRFFQNIHLIMIFGIGGTIVNFMLIALGGYYFPKLLPQYDFGPFSWQKSLLFASVLAGSDEVSALSLIPIDVFPRMGALIFGEGVMNDALSIVLFESLKPLDSGDHVDFTMWRLLQSIVIQLAGAVMIGCGTGLTLSMIMKHFPILRSFPVHQTALVMLFGYLSYTVAQCVEISGILTVFVCAVTMAHYAWHSLSKQAQVATRLSASSLSEIAEGFAFSYVGLSFWGYAQHDFHKVFAVYMIAVVLLARAVTTFGIAAILKLQRARSFELSYSEQHGLFLGGIVRGCLCWAQVLQLHHCPVLVTTTLLIIMVTSIASGVLLPMLLPRLLNQPPSPLKTQLHVPIPNSPAQRSSPKTTKNLFHYEAELSPIISKHRTPVNRVLYQSLEDTSPGIVLTTQVKKAAGSVYSEEEQTRVDQNSRGPGVASSEFTSLSSHSQLFQTALEEEIKENLDERDLERNGVLELGDQNGQQFMIHRGSGGVAGIGETGSPEVVVSSRPPDDGPHRSVDPSHEAILFDQSSWTSQEIRSASFWFLQWIKFDEKVMKPFFGGSLPDHRRKRWLRELMVSSQADAPTSAWASEQSHSRSNNRQAYHRIPEDELEQNDGNDGPVNEDDFDRALTAEEEADKENWLSPYLKQPHYATSYYHQQQEQQQLQLQRMQQEQAQQQRSGTKPSFWSRSQQKKNVSFREDNSVLVQHYPLTFQLPLDADEQEEENSIGLDSDNGSDMSGFCSPTYRASQTTGGAPSMSTLHTSTAFRSGGGGGRAAGLVSPSSVKPIARGLFFHSPPLATQTPHSGPSMSGRTSSAASVSTTENSLRNPSASLEHDGAVATKVSTAQDHLDSSFLSPITMVPSPPLVPPPRRKLQQKTSAV